MQQVFHTTQGDRETIARQLTENGTPVDLGGRNVQFVARHESGDKVVDAPADVVSASAGYVSYTLTTLETGRAGDYSLEWIVTGGADDPTTFPAKQPDKLVVREDVEQTDLVADPLPQDRTVDALFANELNGNLTGNVPVTTLAGGNLSITNGSLDVVDAAGGGTIDADTVDGVDSTQFARTDIAETFEADATLANGALQFGDGSTETFSEATSPTSWEFTPTLDIHESTAVDISNGSTASATEDVTVELYEGIDTTGTLLLSETQSVTVASGGASTVAFIATDESLNETSHHIEIATSGTTLSVDSATETVDEQDWRWDRLGDGTYQLTDARTATPVVEVDSTTGRVSFPAGGGRSDEEVQDVVNALLTAGSNLTATYDDAGNTLTIDLDSHGNAAHTETFVADGDDTDREIFVIAAGAADPAAAGPEDIIFEAQ